MGKSRPVSVASWLSHRAELGRGACVLVNKIAGSRFDNGCFRVYFTALHHTPAFSGRFCVFRLFSSGIDADVLLSDKVTPRIFGVPLASLPDPYVDYLTARVVSRLGLVFAGHKECRPSDVQQPAYEIILESEGISCPAWFDLDRASIDGRLLAFRPSGLSGRLPVRCALKVGSAVLSDSQVQDLEKGDVVFLRPF